MLSQHVEQLEQALAHLFTLVAAAGLDQVDEAGEPVVDVTAGHQQVGHLEPGLAAGVAGLHALLQIGLVDRR